MNKFTGDEWIIPETLVQGLDIGPYELRPNKEATAGLTNRIRGPLGKLFWLEDEVPFDQPIPSAGIVHEVVSEFTHIPEWAKGRKDSIQGVFFGRLAVGDETEVPVAVKPYLSAIGAGMHETTLLLHLEARGFPVYRVLGASWTEEQGYSMITAYEPDSKSLDNVDWTKSLDQPLGEHLTNLDAIKQVGVTLGLLHANGVLHRDTQIKNFAVAGEDVRVIDLAQARVVIDGDYCDENALEAGMFRDVSMFLDSLKNAHFLQGASKVEWQTFFDSVIATSYRSGLYRAGNALLTTCGVELPEIAERVIELHKAY